MQMISHSTAKYTKQSLNINLALWTKLSLIKVKVRENSISSTLDYCHNQNNFFMQMLFSVRQLRQQTIFSYFTAVITLKY